MNNIIWEDLTEEELYNAVLDDYSKHVENNADFKKWARKIVANLCLMMSKVTSFITYLDPKNSVKLEFPENNKLSNTDLIEFFHKISYISKFQVEHLEEFWSKWKAN